jgi:predicted  nucleic acid-binding Zn-ribbon protein
MSSEIVNKSLVTRVERHRLASRGGQRTGREGAETRRGDSDRGGGQEQVRHGHNLVKNGHTMKCPRYNCDYDTATQPDANRSEQQELELLRAHAVVVHIVGKENLVFGCLKCGVKFYPLSAGAEVEEALRRCSLHDQSCSDHLVWLGQGRKVMLDEWVMYLCTLTAARNDTMVPVAKKDEEQYPVVMKEIITRVTEKLVVKPVVDANTRQREMYDAEHSEESRMVSWQQGELVEDAVDTVRMKQLKLKVVSIMLGEDSEGGSFANDISSEGGIVEELVGKPVIAANTGQGEGYDAEDSEESRVISRQKVGLVKMEQLKLKVVSNTLVGNQGDGKMVSVGGGKVTLQCGSCDYSTQPIRPRKARHRLAQHRKVSHTEVVVIPDQIDGMRGGRVPQVHAINRRQRSRKGPGVEHSWVSIVEVEAPADAKCLSNHEFCNMVLWYRLVGQLLGLPSSD